jgi:hypothetical protein
MNTILPIKLRTKPSFAINCVRYIVASNQSMLKQSSYFHSLSISTRRALIICNTRYTMALNGFLILRKINFLSDPNFLTSIDGVSGIDFVKKADPIYERLDQNNILIKIMLFIIAFSNNCSLVTLGSSYEIETISISIDLIHIQDIFVTILCKYLVYKYGFMEAVVSFSALVKCILDISFVLEEMPMLVHSRIYLTRL